MILSFFPFCCIYTFTNSLRVEFVADILTRQINAQIFAHYFHVWWQVNMYQWYIFQISLGVFHNTKQSVD